MTTLTRAQKRRLAGYLSSAAVRAADEFTNTYGPDGGDGDAADTAANAAFNLAARETLARWLRDLPGDEWDRRLPDPATLR